MNETNKIIDSGDAAVRAYAADELAVRMLTELTAEKGPVIGPTYFDGGDVMTCLKGGFHISFADGQVVALKPGEVLVTYPGNTVGITSLKPGGHLRYLVLTGTRVDDFFNSFGFYDRLRFAGEAQDAMFRQAATQHGAGNAAGALSLVRDALITFARQLRAGGRQQFFEAITVIHRNLARGDVRLKPVLNELKISRATLHRLFVENAGVSPGAFLRREQFRLAARLLTTTTLPVGEIARTVGIPSTAYFTAFIRAFAKVPPSELRRRQV